ncbi:hypothetical protein K438DRAFT_234575 [Mycena galopus ATCC 62051]|nr:hypothetical protein K438DRAFT_234575 [Mycena galopus ATCC 62051]
MNGTGDARLPRQDSGQMLARYRKREGRTCSMSSDLAATYAALILADAESEITSEKILALTTAAGVEIEPIWATLLSKALEGKNVKEMLSTIGVSSGPTAPKDPTPVPDTNAKPVDDTPAAADDGNDSDDSDDMFGGGLFD